MTYGKQCMKIVLSLLSVLFVLALIPTFCLADTFSIDNLGFLVLLPEDVYVITQNTDSSSSVWSLLDYDSTYFLDYIKSNDIFLEAIAHDLSYEIVIFGQQNDFFGEIFNFNLYSDDEIIKMMSPSSNKANENLGVKVDSETVYSKDNLKFYSFSGKQSTNGQISYIKSYTTVVNGKAVSIILQSYSDWLTFQHDKSVLRSVVDSVRFEEILNKPISSPTGRSEARYKAILGSFSALIIGIPALLVGHLINKHKKKTVKNKTNLSGAQSLGNNNDKEHKDKGILEIGEWRCECGQINYNMDTCLNCGLSKSEIDYRRYSVRSPSNSGHKNDVFNRELPPVQNEEEIQRIMNGMAGGQLDRNTATVVYGIIIACERMGDSSLAQIMLPKIQDSLVEQYGIKNLPQIVMSYSYILGTLQGRGILTDEEVKQYNEQQLDYVRSLLNSGNTD